MIRTLSLLVRRPDLTRAAFRAHYEQVHAPLAEPMLSGLVHYVRNHVVAHLAGGEPPFDTLSEFGFGQPEDLARVGRLLASEQGAGIRRDELAFMDKPRNVFFGLEPRNLAGTRGRQPQAGAVKLAILVSRRGDRPREDFLAEFDALLTHRLGPGACAAHFHARELGSPLPCEAATFLWLAPESIAELPRSGWAPAEGEARVLVVDECVSRLAADWGAE